MEFARSVDLSAATAKRSLFLFGPRQTGKSTLIRQQLGDAKRIDLLESGACLAPQRATRPRSR